MTERNHGLDALKGVAIVGVVAIHAQFGIVTGLAPARLSEWTALLLGAVPAFMVMTILFAAKEDHPIPRRMRRLIPLYVVWTVIFVLFKHAVSPGGLVVLEPHWGVLDVLLGGEAYYHVYFLAAVIELVLAVPVLVWLTRTPRLAAISLTVAAVYLAVGQPLATMHPALRPLWEEQFVMVWLAAGLAGAALVRYTPPAVVCLVAGLAICIVEQHVATHLHTTATMAYDRVGAVLLGVGAVVASTRWATAPRWLVALGRRSLGIFLIHPIILRGAWTVTGYGYPVGTYVLVIAVTVALSCAIVMLIERTPLRPLVGAGGRGTGVR